MWSSVGFFDERREFLWHIFPKRTQKPFELLQLWSLGKSGDRSGNGRYFEQRRGRRPVGHWARLFRKPLASKWYGRKHLLLRRPWLPGEVGQTLHKEKGQELLRRKSRRLATLHKAIDGSTELGFILRTCRRRRGVLDDNLVQHHPRKEGASLPPKLGFPQRLEWKAQGSCDGKVGSRARGKGE